MPSSSAFSRSICAALVVLAAVATAPAGSASGRQRAAAGPHDIVGPRHENARSNRHRHLLRVATPLDTKITAGPADGSTSSATTATFSFTATAPATFRCSLDAGSFVHCTSPKTYSGLSLGSHSFRVKAVASKTDKSPATRSWTVAAGPAPGACTRPYSASSPWNTPVPADVAIDARSAARVATLDPASQKLTSDPTQFTFPVYYADASTPRVPVTYTDGWFSRVSADGTTLVNTRSIDPSKRVTTMPVPPGTTAADGYDAQIVVIDTSTGEEWDASHFYRDETGYHAWNIGQYHTAWSAVPPYDVNGNPFWIRGPGIPYLSGLIRPCEIANGKIEHALAFAYPKTTTEFVYPATRSDGQQAPGDGMPEGTRLQLDPSISDATIQATWGCTGACFTIAKALQRYGMYVADGSGRPKIMPEYEGTASWNGKLAASTPSPIPLSAFRVVSSPAR